MGRKGDEDYRVTPIAPNSLQLQILGCVNQYGQATDIDVTLDTYSAVVIIEKLAHGLRELGELNKMSADEQTQKEGKSK